MWALLMGVTRKRLDPDPKKCREKNRIDKKMKRSKLYCLPSEEERVILLLETVPSDDFTSLETSPSDDFASLETSPFDDFASLEILPSDNLASLETLPSDDFLLIEKW